jgi:predicted nucleic acid-binding protein
LRFWDTSALVPLILDEPSTPRMAELLSEDPEITVWICTGVEITSALVRRAPKGDPVALRNAETLIASLASVWAAVDQSVAAVDRAKHLAKRHRLRAMDALQLAAALIACEYDPLGLIFITLDKALAAAARAEGFTVLP